MRIARISIALAIALGVAFAPGAALARPGVEAQGACSSVSKWKLNLRPENGGVLRATLEIEEGAAGQAWSISMSDNGTQFFSGTRTSGVGGAIRVRVTTSDRVGSDTVTASATNLVTGETCQASATI